jgi:N-methylhydantoinase A
VEAAVSILELANEHMVQAILDITLKQGVDPADAGFVAGGGAAGLSCVAIGRRLGCRRVYVPESGAALAAAGALIADLAAHHQAMRHATSEAFDFAGVNTALAGLEARCRAFQATTGVAPENVSIDWTAEARYPDQAWEIEAPLRKSRFEGPADVARLVEDFHQIHEDIFAVSDPRSAVEVVGWAATIRCRMGLPRAGRLRLTGPTESLKARRVYFRSSGWVEAQAIRFETMPEGALAVGPAIVESNFTSVVVDPDATARKDASGCLVIDLGQQEIRA